VKASQGLLSEQRQALVAHITRRLNDQDDQTLLLLADLLRDAPQSIQVVSATSRSISRRRFLAATLTSGFVAATAGAVAVWEYGSGRGRELSSDLARAKDEMTRLWGLVHLYEKLDKDGLDQTIIAGMAAMGTVLGGVAKAADLVKTGAQIAEDALIKFETAFPAVRAGITWLEGQISDLAQRLHLLEDAIGRALNEVSPITQALGGFFDMALGLLPPATARPHQRDHCAHSECHCWYQRQGSDAAPRRMVFRQPQQGPQERPDSAHYHRSARSVRGALGKHQRFGPTLGSRPDCPGQNGAGPT
jgi:hypothetical protein